VTAAQSLAAEIERCRSTARDCELVLAKAGGYGPLGPHEDAEEAVRRLKAELAARSTWSVLETETDLRLAAAGMRP
jgi:hypothetical protein